MSGIPYSEMERADGELSTNAHHSLLLYRCNGTSRSRLLLPEDYLSGKPRSALPEGVLVQSLITVKEN